MSEPVILKSGELTAQIAALGAELVSLKDIANREYMSDGDPAFWRGRAPLLFPIVGQLNGNTLRHDGQAYTLEKHGFARRSTFDLVCQSETSAQFRLTDGGATRTVYPFAFQLDMAFALDGAKLSMRAQVRNTGDTPMPFSFGYHPAFAWPLPDGGEKLDHEIVFEQAEPAPIRRLDKAGLVARSEAGPVKGNRFTLHPDLFEDDAMIWDDLVSRQLEYISPAGARLEIDFANLPMLGIWQKPGAAFVCVEPWAGIADSAGYEGEFADKRGVCILPAGEAQHFTMDVTLRQG